LATFAGVIGWTIAILRPKIRFCRKPIWLGYGIIKVVQDISTQYLLLEAHLDDIFYTKFVQYIYN